MIRSETRTKLAFAANKKGVDVRRRRATLRRLLCESLESRHLMAADLGDSYDLAVHPDGLIDLSDLVSSSEMEEDSIQVIAINTEVEHFSEHISHNHPDDYLEDVQLHSLNESLFALGKSEAVYGPVTSKPAQDRTEDASIVKFGDPPFTVPSYNSIPNARVSLYLDFDGHVEATWGGYTNVVTPPLDRDGNLTNLGAEELSFIQDVWRIVAEDYAPFNINVTTVEPPALAPNIPSASANGVALRLAIGGTSSILGLGSGIIGYAYINSFTSATSNVAYVFPTSSTGSHSSAFTIATTVSHEAGHSFGLRHLPGAYDISGQTQGIMSPIVLGYEDAFWMAAVDEFGTLQDDMAILANTTNGFGYRADDRGNTIANASQLTGGNGTYTASGIIGTNTDVDVWSLAGVDIESVRVTVDGAAVGQNLDAVIDLLDASGNVLMTADSIESDDTALIFENSGVKYLRVRSNGAYGRIGQYTLTASPSIAGVQIVAADSLLTSENGSTGSIAVSLTSKPTSNVSILFQSSNQAEGSVDSNPMVFTPSNWYLPQSISVVGSNDAVLDGPIAYSVGLSVVSSDSSYNAMPLSSLPAINADDDAPGWTKQLVGATETSDVYTNDMQIDSDGNIILGGSFSGTVDFDLGAGVNQQTSNSPTSGAFIAKYSAEGALIWVQEFGSSSGLTNVYSLAMDGSGGVYFSGYTSSASLTLGSTTLTNSGLQSAILAKLNSAGQFVWATSFGGAGSVVGYDLSKDANDNLVVAGDFDQTVDFNPGSGVASRTAAGGRDGYVARFTNSGTFQSVSTFGATENEFVRELELDASGNAYVSGYFVTSTLLGGQSLTSSGASDGFLFKMSSTGVIQWVRQAIVDSGSGSSLRLERSSTGELVWGTTFSGTIQFGAGTTTLTSVGTGDVYLTRWDESGNFISAGQLSSPQSMQLGSIQFDSQGNLAIYGRMRGIADLDPTAGISEFAPIGTNADFVLRLNGQSQILNAFILPSISASGIPRDLALDGRGNVFVAGQFYDSVLTPTGDIVPNSISSFDTYLVKLNVVPGVTVNSPQPLRTSESSGQASFSVVLDIQPTSDVTLDFASSDLGEGMVSPSQVTFTPLNWNVPKFVTITGVDDSLIDGEQAYSISISTVSSDAKYNDLLVAGLAAINVDNDQPLSIFTDSFEAGEWNGLWVEDSQNDWYRSTQRATQGSYSAEVDGAATNATLTNSSPLDLRDFQQTTLVFDWLIESGFDTGEFLSLDISANNGATWTQDVRRLNGNVSVENTWQRETVDLTPFQSSNVKIRFRSTVSAADEDANIDNVLVTGIPLGPNQNPIGDAGGPYILNEGSSIALNGSSSSDPDGTIVSYAWDLDGDGQYDDSTGAAPNFATTLSGTYSVGLLVTDNRGGMGSSTAAIVVNNVAPTAFAGQDQNGNVGSAIQLSAAASTDPGNDIVSYLWDLDNDGQFDDSAIVNPAFTSQVPGTFTVRVQVTDADGASSIDQAILTVISVPVQVTLFEDSFEVSEWNGKWVEDAQNDWYRSTQRATHGTQSAEVDGSATNATLTLAAPVNLVGYTSSLLTFSWLIENSFDAGEYLSLDVSTNGGTTWQNDIRRLSGNVSTENVWQSVTVDMTGYAVSNVLIRFRSSVSDSTEDANVDNVKIVAIQGSAAGAATFQIGEVDNDQKLPESRSVPIDSIPSPIVGRIPSMPVDLSSTFQDEKFPVADSEVHQVIDALFSDLDSLLNFNFESELAKRRLGALRPR